MLNTLKNIFRSLWRGGFIRYARQKIYKKAHIQFIHPEVFYSYTAPYRDRTMPGKVNLMICSVGCALTLCNESDDIRVVRALQLAAQIGEATFELKPFDGEGRPAGPVFVMPAKSFERISWNAPVNVVGNGGSFNTDSWNLPPETPVVFKLTYFDEKWQTKEMVMEVDLKSLMPYCTQTAN